MRAVKAIVTCQMGKTGNECFKEETFLPLIHLSSSPVLPLWSLAHSAVCHVLISVFFIAYCGPVSAIVQQRYQQNVAELGGS